MWLGTWLRSQSQVSKRQTKAILRAPLWERHKHRDLGIMLSIYTFDSWNVWYYWEKSEFTGLANAHFMVLYDFLQCWIMYRRAQSSQCFESKDSHSFLLEWFRRTCFKNSLCNHHAIEASVLFPTACHMALLICPTSTAILPHTSHPLLPNLCHSPITVAGAPTHWLVLLVTRSMFQYQILPRMSF